MSTDISISLDRANISIDTELRQSDIIIGCNDPQIDVVLNVGHEIENILLEVSQQQVLDIQIFAKSGEKGEKGDKGEQGIQGIQGVQGLQGLPGQNGIDGANGADGLSAYQIALLNGFDGTEQEWLESLKGDPGTGGGSLPPIAKNLTLLASGWENLQQTITDSDILENSFVVISAPVNRAQFLEFGERQISCTASAAGSLTFQATTLPNIDLIINVKIYNYA
jgi:hypothetical protein